MCIHSLYCRESSRRKGLDRVHPRALFSPSGRMPFTGQGGRGSCQPLWSRRCNQYHLSQIERADGDGESYLAAHPTAHTSRWGTGTGRRARTAIGRPVVLASLHIRSNNSSPSLLQPPTTTTTTQQALRSFGDGRANLAAGGKVLALGDDALVVVDVVLPAVLGLVGVGEAGVDT